MQISCSITPQRTHGHTTSTEHAAAPGCSHHFPAQKKEQNHPAHSKLCRANETEWACEMRNGPKPSPRTHSFTHRQIIHAASMGTAEAPSKRRRTLGFTRVDAVHADFVKVSRFPRNFTRFSHGIHKVVSPPVKFASNTALAHPRGVADRMFFVRCDLPPSPAACGA